MDPLPDVDGNLELTRATLARATWYMEHVNSHTKCGQSVLCVVQCLKHKRKGMRASMFTLLLGNYRGSLVVVNSTAHSYCG